MTYHEHKSGSEQAESREGSTPTKAPSRKQIIVKAAAALLVEEGMKGFTHRKIATKAGVPLGSTTQYFSTIDDLRKAALAELLHSIENDLNTIEELLRHEGATPESIAQFLYSYTMDKKRVRTESLLYAAALYDRGLCPLVAQWFDEMVHVLSNFMDVTSARAIVIFMDGVYMKACFSDEVDDLSFLTNCITALMKEKR